MAVDVFLEFPKPALGLASGPLANVAGETQDKAHPNTIPLTSFSLGIENTSSVGSASGGAGAGKATFQAFEVTKAVDAASPGLFAVAAAGGHFEQANVYVRKAGGGATDYLVYRLKPVFVSNIGWSVNAGDESPSETVKFTYGALQVQYTSQPPSGAQRAPTTTAWSQITNKAEFAVPGIP